jgi:hypothetical protein
MLTGFGPNNIWIAGTRGTMFQFDGTNSTRFDFPIWVSANSVWGFSPSELWAVGPSGMILVKR